MKPRHAVLVFFMAALVCIVLFHAVLQHWLAIHTGTLNESGPYYGFFSGFGSDLGEATLITGLFTIFRHRNCHVKGCWRMGKQVEGTAYLACHVHHPDHHGNKRNVDVTSIHEAHQAARERKAA